MLRSALLAIAAIALAVPSDDEASQAAQLVAALETSPNPYLAEKSTAVRDAQAPPTSPAVLRQNLCHGDRGYDYGCNDCDSQRRPPRRPYRDGYRAGPRDHREPARYGGGPEVDGEPWVPPLTPERVVHTFTKAHTKTQTSTNYAVETEYRTRTVTDTLYHTNTTLYYPEETYTLTGYDTFYEYPGFTKIGGTHRAGNDQAPTATATPVPGPDVDSERPHPISTEIPIPLPPDESPDCEPRRGELHHGDHYRAGPYRGEPRHYYPDHRGEDRCDDRVPPRRERECDREPAPRRHRWFGRRRGGDCN